MVRSFGEAVIRLEYAVDVSAYIGDAAAEMELGDRLLTALENRVAGPAVSQHSNSGIVSATVCVMDTDPLSAARKAFNELVEALRIAGVEGKVRLVELQVVEEHEEAAAGAAW